MRPPTKAHLAAAVAKLTDENKGLRDEIGALYDLFAAARDSADAGHSYPWIIGYIGGMNAEANGGNVRLLRAHAEAVRFGPKCGAVIGNPEDYVRCRLAPHGPERDHDAADVHAEPASPEAAANPPHHVTTGDEPASAPMTITITRTDNYRPDGSGRHFIYSYTPSEPLSFNGKHTYPANVPIEYGRSLVALREMLRRAVPGVMLVEAFTSSDEPASVTA